MKSDVQRLSALSPDRARGFGAKARTLAVLMRRGFAVPVGFAISAGTAERFAASVLEPRDDMRALLDGPDVDATRLAEIRSRIMNAPWPSELEDELGESFDALCKSAPDGVAVRSSSLLEDDVDASAAGINATVLGVRTRTALLLGIRTCWASLYSPAALHYLKTHGRGRTIAMGVVVQAMIRSEASGVAFTRHPLTGDDQEIVIESSYGLGTLIAEGGVGADIIRVQRDSLAVRDRIVGDKRTMVVLGLRGPEETVVAEALRGLPSLSDSQASDVARLAIGIEAALGAPVDVEFCIANDSLFVLQARPITGATKATSRKRARAGVDPARFVWSNINVGESLPGVATPFTWSVLSAFSDLGFRRAFGALGCSVPANAELVGEFRGRIYLNMSEFMLILSQVPGFDARVITALGGGDFASHIQLPAVREGEKTFLARLPLTIARLARESLVVDSRVAAFEAVLDEERRRVEAIDLRLLSSAALDRTLLDVEHMLDELGAVMLTAYGSLLASVVVLDAWLRLLAGGDAAVLERDLFTGIAAVESAAPGLLLGRLADSLVRDSAASEYLATTLPADLSLDDLPDGSTRRSLTDLLARYGHRGFREAEIAEPRWREDPRALLAALRLHVVSDESPAIREARYQRIGDARLGAERRLDQLVPWGLRGVARALVTRVQRLIGTREKLRSDVIGVLGNYRTVVLEVSRRIASREPSAGRDAAFFLTVAEVHANLDGTLPLVGGIVAKRRARYERDRSLADPPSTFIGAPPEQALVESSLRVLRGLAASSGIAEGLVRVVRSTADIDAFENGEVLVVASADVGWSPVFLHAAAVVTALGGPLSHAAIVLRELGVPSVLNVRDATSILHTGEHVRVDGERGEVVRLTPPVYP